MPIFTPRKPRTERADNAYGARAPRTLPRAVPTHGVRAQPAREEYAPVSTGGIPNPFRIHFVPFESISNPFRIHFESISNPFRIHFESISNPFRIHFESILRRSESISWRSESISNPFRVGVEVASRFSRGPCSVCWCRRARIFGVRSPACDAKGLPRASRAGQDARAAGACANARSRNARARVRTHAFCAARALHTRAYACVRVRVFACVCSGICISIAYMYCVNTHTLLSDTHGASIFTIPNTCAWTPNI